MNQNYSRMTKFDFHLFFLLSHTPSREKLKEKERQELWERLNSLSMTAPNNTSTSQSEEGLTFGSADQTASSNYLVNSNGNNDSSLSSTANNNSPMIV